VGPLADGIFSRSSFALDAAKGRPAIPAVEKLYEDANHKVLNDNTSREFTAFLVLADALNRAGSTDPAKLQAALVATDVPGNMTIMPWKGVKFDATGQNIEGTPVIQEIVDGKYMTVWPFDLATHQADWDLK
jgi:branched-chain amino acid transport system substrate-binding protein